MRWKQGRTGQEGDKILFGGPRRDTYSIHFFCVDHKGYWEAGRDEGLITLGAYHQWLSTWRGRTDYRSRIREERRGSVGL